MSGIGKEGDGWVSLSELRTEVEARCRAIEEAHGSWPCRSGCDHCCRNLARLPEVSEIEWAEIEKALGEMAEEDQARIRDRMDALQGPPFVCPFLDDRIGMCTIYRHRPVACRTYGFYVEREGGRYCGMIREHVEEGRMNGVVWGNHHGVEARLNSLGTVVDLREWRALTRLLFFNRS